MKSRTVYSLMLSMIMFLFIAFTGNIQAQVVVNENGSFESSEVTVGEDTTGTIEGWSLEIDDTGDANFIIVDDTVQAGDRALAVIVNATGANAWNIQAINEVFDVVPGQAYTLSVWLKSSAAGSSVDVTIGNPSFNEFGRSSEEVGTEWEEFTLDFTVPSGDTLGRAPLHFSFDENVGDTIWVDNLTVSYPNLYPVLVEAESGEIGDEWEIVEEEDISYITITTDHSETSGTPDYPGENRTVSYEVTFPAAGNYDLFAKVRVGSDTFDDDSWFTPHGFGEKDPANAEDWNTVNGMQQAGYAESSAVVREAGGLGEEVWKWVNLSKNGFQSEPSDTFIVEEGALTQTFVIGGREDGFDIDRIAFGGSDLYFTVENLENGEAGSTQPPAPPVEPLDPIADGKDKFLGNVYSASQIEDFTSYWNQVTPENAGKWGSVEGTQDNMNWNALDAAYDLAKDNGFPFRFHILTWGGQQPGWINDLSTEEQLEEIEEWYDAVAERYPDMEYVEVVNEGSNSHQLPDGQSGEANYIEALGGTGATGHDWIITAFEMARERFPDSKLMINDYGIVGNVTATNNYLNIIEDLQERDLIDVIGVQAHAFSVVPAEPSNLERTLDMLGETGLPIQATEMDIDGNPDGTEAESDAVQQERYQRIFPIFWEHTSVEGVTLWGWRPGLWRNDEEAFLVRNNGEERPALEWLRAYVDSAQVSVGIEDLRDGLPVSHRLYNNYPNPFNPTTQIKYDVAKASDVNIKVYDITGRLVQTLVDNRQASGTYTVSFDASGLSTGVYFYRIQTGSFMDVKQMMLIK